MNGCESEIHETNCTAVAATQVRNTSKSVLNTDTKTAVEKSGVVGLETMTNLKTSGKQLTFQQRDAPQDKEDG